MKILPFHDGIDAIRKQLKELNEKIESSDVESEATGFNKREFLNSVILESMNESEREKEQILNSLVEKVCYLDLDYKIKWINDAGLRNVGDKVSINDIIGQTCYKVWYNRSEPCPSCPVETTIKTNWPWKEEVSHPDGTTILVSSQPVIDDNGKMTGTIEIELDITMRKDVERALERSQQRARALLDLIPDFLLIIDNEGKILDYHPAADFNVLSNIEYPEGRMVTEVFSPELSGMIMTNCDMLTEQGVQRNFEYVDKSGKTEKFYDCRFIQTTDTETVCIIRDISTHKSREKEILHRSFHDKLTGLYNRAYFEEECNRIDQSRESLPTSILVIDVNSLKLINDAFGHDFGDKLLLAVSNILSANCRKSDVIARTGGDEFAIILPKSPREKAEKLSERIRRACLERHFDDIFARPSVSIGSAERTDNSQTIDDIIKLADKRMYDMKLERRTEHLNTLISDILNSMQIHGQQSKNHTENCIKLSIDFAVFLNLPKDSVKKIKNLALLHDIGNIRLSNEILSKSDRLSETEYDEIKQHPIIGYRITKAIPDYSSVADLILHHHERWDGQGYPSGLKGKDIPLLCRLFSIIDTWELLINGSTYKPSLSFTEAANEIRRCSGKQFDPEIAGRFIQFIKEKQG
ncbi:MAG: diguanylate cyclase [Spirochaetales bacterium]|uniref:Diguanylate cyclase n=1 Tax=Candidatus Thalassospirochaeta sargassi TaxID=3119039 RepID=A0AAJ1IFC5_9SPIO|nr:diguanylate cyclase [Spirochaetales bacterium]